MTWEACKTSNGRPAYVVNVEVYLHRDDRWLLIRRSARESHAPGALAGVGGKLDIGGQGSQGDVLELTARREVAEEVGVDLTGVELAYVTNSYFVTDDGDPVVNVVLAGAMPAGAEPRVAAPDEVAGIVWLTLAETESDPFCPLWTLHALRRAAAGHLSKELRNCLPGAD